MKYIFLFLAIVAEVIATSAMKASNQFTLLLPSLLTYRNADQKASIPNCNSAISAHGNVACQQDKDHVYDRLVSASKLMNDAFYLLSNDGCSLSAAKLADAIVYLDVTISHRRVASLIEK